MGKAIKNKKNKKIVEKRTKAVLDNLLFEFNIRTKIDNFKLEAKKA